MKFILALLVTVVSTAAMAADCMTLESAKEALVEAAARGDVYPFAGTYTVADFSKLVAEEDSPAPFCKSGFDDCLGQDEMRYATFWSFAPGERGWVGVSASCEVFAEVTFRD